MTKKHVFSFEFDDSKKADEFYKYCEDGHFKLKVPGEKVLDTSIYVAKGHEWQPNEITDVIFSVQTK